MEAGVDKADAVLDSIVMDETTNSILRISPVSGGNELRPKVVVIPRVDLWKLRYLDDKVLRGIEGGRGPAIEDVATLITESNLAGTVTLNEDDGISVNDELKRSEEWESAVHEGKLLEFVKIELDKISSRDKYSQEELNTA